MTAPKCEYCQVTKTESVTCRACQATCLIEKTLKGPQSVFRKILQRKNCLVIYHQIGNIALSEIIPLNRDKIALKKAILRTPAFHTLESLNIKNYFLNIETVYDSETDEWDMQVKLFLPKAIAEDGYKHVTF